MDILTSDGTITELEAELLPREWLQSLNMEEYAAPMEREVCKHVSSETKMDANFYCLYILVYRIIALVPFAFT